MYNFKDDLDYGHVFEDIFCHWLESKQKQYTRAPKESSFKAYDVESEGYTYEIKADRWIAQTRNVCVETFIDTRTQKKGWLFETEADYLIVFESETLFHMIPMHHIKSVFYKDLLNGAIRKEVYQENGAVTETYLLSLDKFEIRTEVKI